MVSYNVRQGSSNTYIFVNILQFMKPNVPANNNLVVFANDNLSRITLMRSDHLTTLAAYKLPALQSRDFHHPGKKKSDQVDKIYLLRRLPSLLQNKGF